MPGTRVSIFDVWLTSKRIKRSNGVAADQVAYVAIGRGPLDPAVRPEDAVVLVATVAAVDRADAIAQAKDRRDAMKSRGRHRRPCR